MAGTRVPLLSGTRLVLATAPGGAVLLRPPPPGEPVADVAAAVRDALRFPLEGEGLEALAGRGTRATIVIEPPALPIPGSPDDPRQHAISAVVAELERLGIPTGYQTVLVASGLARRTSQRDLSQLVTAELARRFHGHVVVHDVEDPELVPLDRTAGPPLRFLYRALPEALQRDVLRSLRTHITVAAAFGGPPSVAHAEALLRAVELRRAELPAPLDALVIGVPRTTPYMPRE